MSIAYTADLFCDTCSLWTEGEVQHYDAKGLAKKVHAIGKKEGWIRQRGENGKILDICPTCQKRQAP